MWIVVNDKSLKTHLNFWVPAVADRQSIIWKKENTSSKTKRTGIRVKLGEALSRSGGNRDHLFDILRSSRSHLLPSHRLTYFRLPFALSKNSVKSFPVTLCRERVWVISRHKKILRRYHRRDLMC